MFIFRNRGNLVKLGECFRTLSEPVSPGKFTNNTKVTIIPCKNSPRFFCDGTVDKTDGQMTNINFDEITKGDKDQEHKLKVIMLEAELLKQEGRLVPDISFLKKHHWEELLRLNSRAGRGKYFEFLFISSKRKEKDTLRKEERRKKYEEFKAEQEHQKNEDETIEDFALKYDLQHNNIFLRIYESTMSNFYNSRLIPPMLFGQKFVVDCGFGNEMNRRENLNCAKQLVLLFAENRVHHDPFDLHFCNVDMEDPMIKSLERHIPPLKEPWFPLHLHQNSYLELFPKEQLVYLTPHCREEITQYDHDAIYIMGAIVDKASNEPLSLAKAKRERIRMQKLPLDKYLLWGSGSGKSLTLNQVASILLDARLTGDWNHALRHVPRRKLIDHIQNSSSSSNTDFSRRSVKHGKWVPNFRASGDNFNKTSQESKWTPSSGIELNKLSYRGKSKKYSKADSNSNVGYKGVLNK